MLRNDVKYLKKRYSLDIKGKNEGRIVLKYVPPTLCHTHRYSNLFFRNETASEVYSLDVITKMFKEEGGKMFDSRSASLGHTLQGGIPSPTDRARAVRLALKCMSFMEHHHQLLLKQPGNLKKANVDSAAVITIQGSGVIFVPATEMQEHADTANRRGTQEGWAKVADLVEDLVARKQILEKEREKNPVNA